MSIVNNGSDDRADLFDALREAGLSDELVEALNAALDADDGRMDDSGGAGPAVSGWWAEVRQQVTATVLTGLWGIATTQLGLPAT